MSRQRKTNWVKYIYKPHLKCLTFSLFPIPSSFVRLASYKRSRHECYHLIKSYSHFNNIYSGIKLLTSHKLSTNYKYKAPCVLGPYCNVEMYILYNQFYFTDIYIYFKGPFINTSNMLIYYILCWYILWYILYITEL